MKELLLRRLEQLFFVGIVVTVLGVVFSIAAFLPAADLMSGEGVVGVLFWLLMIFGGGWLIVQHHLRAKPDATTPGEED